MGNKTSGKVLIGCHQIADYAGRDYGIVKKMLAVDNLADEGKAYTSSLGAVRLGYDPVSRNWYRFPDEPRKSASYHCLEIMTERQWDEFVKRRAEATRQYFISCGSNGVHGGHTPPKPNSKPRGRPRMPTDVSSGSGNHR